MKNLKNYVPITLEQIEAKYIGTNLTGTGDDLYWLVYSPEIVFIIDKYETEGKYPYNRDIEDLAHQYLFPEIEQDKDNRQLAHIVYNSQSYRHAKKQFCKTNKLINTKLCEQD